jgi:uncharacterized protein YdeI (YjbR/CyaY-like superfamily)
MPTTDPRVDAYIENAADFAKPVLTHLRVLVQRVCPDVEETMKWRMPTFMYHGIMCGMAAFKQHVSFGFWKHALVMGEGVPRDGMGSFGKVTKLSDLPSDATLKAHIKTAMRLNEQGVKTRGVRKTIGAKPPPVAPEDLSRQLKKNRQARATFDALSLSHQREYIEWITEAKREETRSRRLAQAIAWLAEGKVRNWKYLNC